MNKQLLRIWVKEKRKELDMAKISAILADKLVQIEEYKNAKNIMLFYPLKDEVDLLSILEDKSKNFYLPRINGDELECCPYCASEELCISRFHTKEPICEACAKSEIDLIIVPALACDKNNFRLGYGKGFYDRFLKDYKGKTISCIPHEFFVETVFPFESDIKIDRVLTDLL